jgi:integrase
MTMAEKMPGSLAETAQEPNGNQIENRTAYQLSDELARDLVCPEGRPNHDFRDQRLTGFVLRVSSTGKKSWQVIFKVHGKKQRFKIGAFPAWNCAKAAKRAADVIRAADQGKNPSAAKKELRTALTFADLVDAYEKDKRGKLRKVGTTVHLLRRYCGSWLSRRAVDIVRQDARDVLADFVRRDRPHLHNQVLAHMHVIYKWAVRQDLIPADTVNPAANLNRMSVGDGRDRWLDEGELRRFWRALAETRAYRDDFADMARVALLTGQREMEVGLITWQELKLDATDKEGNPSPGWTIPDTRTKNKHDHYVPLTAPVATIFNKYAAAARMDGTYRPDGLVFWTRDHMPVRHDYFQDHMNRTCKTAGLGDVVFHDLRRTCSTWMAAIEVDELTNDRVLNHRSGRKARNSVHRIYDRYEYAKEKRAALEQWAAKLDEIVGGLVVAQTGTVRSIARAVG